MKRERNWMIHLLSVITIFGLFLLTSLILANVGMHSYKNVVLANNNNFELRTSLSYVATKIRQYDSADSIGLINMDGQTVLVLNEEIDNEIYETLIYHSNGFLYELFMSQGMIFDSNNGTPLMEIHEFNIEEHGNNMMKLRATNKSGEHEELILSLRSRRH